MKKNFLNISGKIERVKLAALEKIANIADSEEIPFFIVGATARDLILEKAYNIRPFRATLDIDVGVRVADWNHYKKLREGLVRTGEYKQTEEFQRLLFRNKLNVDLIPFGQIADELGNIRWPTDDQIVLNIIGFEEAFANSQKVMLRDYPKLEINVVTLVGLTVMKIISWNDRDSSRKKDASDLALIMDNYTDAGNMERIFNEHSDLLDTEDFDYVLAGVRLLGRDVATILSVPVKNSLLEILDKETGKQEQYKLIEDMLISNVLIDADFNRLLSLLEEFKRGLLEWL